MTAQQIKGFSSKAFPACYVLTNQRLGKQCYPSIQCSKTLPIKVPTKAQKDEDGKGKDFSGFLT